MEKKQVKNLLLILGSILILFIIFMAKKINFGNTMSKQTEEIVDYILNREYYEANLELKITDQEKNIVNLYEIKQVAENENYYQEVINKQNDEKIQMEYKDGNLKILNANLNLEKSYQNYHNKIGNNIFLTTFIQCYKQKADSRYFEENNEIILETTEPNNKKVYNKKLYIDKRTQKPMKIIFKDSTGREVINIKYNDIDFKNK